ncbi:MAG: helix-turn-helix transcriptional regulator [Hyphomonadaceae bacterium]|nr:helix-turn-helix transcriptional regulator [Hyphomonadaceae bacterium]
MTTRARRLSPQAIQVLAALAEKRSGWLYGLQVAAATELKSGSLYPILIRLDERGLLESKWIEPEYLGRPARHAYRITGAGRAALSEALASRITRFRGAPA